MIFLRIAVLTICVLAIAVTGDQDSALAAPKDGTALKSDSIHLKLTTTDGRTQNVRIDQVWRLRESFAEGERKGRTVVDFAFARLFVKDEITDVVTSVEKTRSLVRFTAPNGAATFLVTDKIVDVQKALRHQHHPESKSVISTREGQQQVRETKSEVLEIIEKTK